jgi:hypothetical protein
LAFMVPEPQTVARKADVSVLRPRGRSGAKRWPLLWTIGGAVVASLLLWAGIVFVGALVIDAISGAS